MSQNLPESQESSEKKVGKETWASRLGFVTAAAGSAIGLANIWRFPYVVGQNGGGAFLIVYFAFLLLVSYPLLVAEVALGRHARKSPPGAFALVAKRKFFWRICGKLSVLTGFLISSFYAVVAGWIIGYLWQAILGHLTHLETSTQAMMHFTYFMRSPIWSLGFQAVFIALSTFVLLGGVRRGIEWASKWLIPLLFGLLIVLIVQGFFHVEKGQLSYLLTVDFSKMTGAGVLVALGQAFFTLSLGQGTMVTYGSYLSKKTNIVSSCALVLLFDTLAALLAVFAIFSIAGTSQASQAAGSGLIFSLLPVAFSSLPLGHLFSIAFFLLVAIAALTSQISAMEPLICYLQEKGLSRRKAALACSIGAYVVGVPSALSFAYDWSFYDVISFLSLNILVPLGSLLVAVLIGWIWKSRPALEEIEQGASHPDLEKKSLYIYFKWTWKFIAIILIALVFIENIYPV